MIPLRPPARLSLRVALLLLVALLHSPLPIVASCEQCALTGNCTAALPNNQPGTFCATTTTPANHTAYLCCPPTLACVPYPNPPTSPSCQPPRPAAAQSSTASTAAASSSTDSLSASPYASYAFIAASLLLAGGLAVLALCVGCQAAVACGSRWRHSRRRQLARKAVVPVEGEQDRRDREQREAREREERERRQEQADEARLKEDRLRSEQAEMEAIVQRAREQVERRRRERLQAALEAAVVETSDGQRTEEGREGELADATESAARSLDEIELGHV